MSISEVYWELKKSQHHLTAGQVKELVTFILGYEWDGTLTEQNDLLDWKKYQTVLTLLNQQIPVAYITQNKNFFGQDFYVDQQVLIPRSETEIVAQAALTWLKNYPTAQVLDLGCGSGVLGLTIKKFFPQTTVYLSDISPSALKVAQVNAQRQQLEVNYLEGDFLAPILKNNLKFDLIICNPPYIDRNDQDVNDSTRFEPQIALYAPENGLYFYRELFKNLALLSKNPAHFCLVMEIGWKQKPVLETLMQEFLDFNHYQFQFQKDYSQHWRCIIINKIN